MEGQMESARCNIIYVDRAVSEDRNVQSSSLSSGAAAASWESSQLRENVRLLLSLFESAFLCGTGGACLEQWRKLLSDAVTSIKPTIILLETPFREPIPSKPQGQLPSAESELYGVALLEEIDAESSAKDLSSLVMVIPFVTQQGSVLNIGSNSFETFRGLLVDRGATDAVLNPLSQHCLDNIRMHAKRVCRNLRHRQRRDHDGSLAGEEMVFRLLPYLCPSIFASDHRNAPNTIQISAEDRALVSHAIAEFQFDAPKFSDQQLIVAASLMFQHAFSVPELAMWQLGEEELQQFIVACCTAYRPDVDYHNFCHVVDVLQHIFYTLIRIGALPPYPSNRGSTSRPSSNSDFAQCIEPHVALALLITAIGHDVGHPGVNNGFLVKTKDPLADAFHHKSVLECYHGVAFTCILKKYWPKVYNCSKIKDLVVDSILATDMAVHLGYMEKLNCAVNELERGRSQEDLARNSPDATMEERKSLICALLIKCADISNVARRYDTAVKWMHTLAAETTKQREKERLKHIPTSVFSTPGTDPQTLAKNQLLFMDNFAAPLFEGVAKLIPELQFCVDAIAENKKKFEAMMENVDEHGNSPSQMDFANAQQPNSSQHPVRPGPTVPEVNGINTQFDTDDDSHSHYASKQRCSETTEVSSAPDSAGTGKMPLSPSTQGTSIVSINSSVDPPVSCVVTSSTPDSFKNQTQGSFQHQVPSENGYLNGHTNHVGSDTQSGLGPGGQLRKKPSFIQKIGNFIVKKTTKGSASSAGSSP
ncbi:putative camp-specific 3',5'-cyclic phosphodiesterase [Triangularia verruculosa]|uniref:Phosphodiesterase n=1 Tax=Triangularia verruculosa TaxID=2587418 RepID=A0AAN6XQ57_9PEZI|nr:putative camp-specific 3',5'-cyclic phosphodiesterase [Triangularia verruculosa]